MFPADVKHIEGAQDFINERVKGLGKWTRAQKNTLFAFIVAVTLWVFPGILSAVQNIAPDALDADIIKTYNKYFPEAIAAMIGGLLLFVLPVDTKSGKMTLEWKEGVKGIEWGTLLLFGGGLAIGGMVFSTGLSQWIGESLTSMLGGNPSEIVFLTLFSVTALFLSELTSNTAVANLMGPIAIATAVSMGFSPIPVCVVMALCTSLAFMLPVSTPPNAIVYASGYIPITKMIKAGIILDIIGVFLITVPLVYFLVKAFLGV
jgi:sodium-dependent dicarboxylate transporter 2/3/5